jgi:hypothetical protein
MDNPRSISVEIFELFKRAIDQANRVDSTIKSLERKDFHIDEIIQGFDNFAKNIKEQIQGFVERTNFQIDQSLKLYEIEHQKVAKFLEESTDIKVLHDESIKIKNEIAESRFQAQMLIDKINDSYENYQRFILNLNDKANKHLDMISDHYSDKIDIVIKAKIDRDLKGLENQILLKNKLLEGRVAELSTNYNTLFSIFQLLDLQKYNDNQPEYKTYEISDKPGSAPEMKKIDKFTQKQLSITNEIESKIEQFGSAMRDFEARMTKEKKDIIKLVDSVVPKDNTEYKNVTDRFNRMQTQFEEVRKVSEQSNSRFIVAIAIAIISVILNIILALM